MSELKAETPWVFLSYRRANSGHWIARRVASELDEHLGPGATFLDVVSIDGGRVWTQEVEAALVSSSVVFILIHPGWLDSRIHHADDWVRREVATAMRLGILTVPVLIDGATMPAASELPEDIARLTSLEACFVEGRSEASLQATIKTLTQMVMKKVPCRVTIRRALPGWSISSYDWHVTVDKGIAAVLLGSATEASFTSPPGIHTLGIKWSEREFTHPRHGPPYNSYGESEKRMAFHPGEYVFVLERLKDLRPWWRKLASGLIGTDRALRNIKQESFVPFKKK